MEIRTINTEGFIEAYGFEIEDDGNILKDGEQAYDFSGDSISLSELYAIVEMPDNDFIYLVSKDNKELHEKYKKNKDMDIVTYGEE
jgi:hypothetical protein